MHGAHSPSIPVYARRLGSWQLRIEREPLSTDALARAYDREAPGWAGLVHRLGYGRAYRRIFNAFFSDDRAVAGTGPIRILDCGVGTGAVATAAVRALKGPYQLSAVDISPQMVATARQRFARAGISAWVTEASVMALPFADNSFDVVTAAHVLEHLPEPVAALAEMRRVLRPGGWIVTCLTRESWLGAYIQAKWRTHRLNPGRAAHWLRAAGFTPTPFDQTGRGFFRLTSLTAIGHNTNAGTPGMEHHQ
ncbi:MAG: methyltransferase domain-containing protein [Pseudomonadota bacterium]